MRGFFTPSRWRAFSGADLRGRPNIVAGMTGILRIGIFIFLMGRVAAADVSVPARAAEALSGTEFSQRVAGLSREEREAAVEEAVRGGNVPTWWARFVDVAMGEAVIAVSPDYVCVGTDEDYWLAPLTPRVAQRIADELGCVLPTRKMVSAIWRAAPLKLEPATILPSKAMTTAPIFTQHNTTVREQRGAALAAHPAGTLVAGHKKDVVITPRLATAPGKVAIYGWHRPNGTAIQPLHLGHAQTWADYSHGVRLVKKAMTVAGVATTVDAVLADKERCALLSDEGPVVPARYRDWAAEEKIEELAFDGGVRCVVNAPANFDAQRPTRLVVYAAPAGNTIEHTVGRKVKAGDDWHFNIQHIGAQTRWLRARESGTNLVVAYLQAEQRSFVLWKRAHPDHPQRVVAIVAALREKFPSAKLVLTGHSAGGSFTFSYLDGVERVADDVERIAFLDSNYAYETDKNHAAKLAEWLAASPARRLSVLAYEDHVALLGGKTFVSESGGTWGRSQAMLRDFAETWTWARSDKDGLQRHTALGGRVEFLLKENPEKAVLHTRQVELNGFIHAMLAGTEASGKGYVYLGARAYGEWITEK